MWLYRGAQSAVFYYATCTPCAESSYRRNRMKEAAKSKREQERTDTIVTDQPKPFAQPTPFSTNPAWAEEIALGPGPPARRGGRNHRRKESWNTDGLSADSQHDLGSATSRKDKLKHPLGERWSRMRYQREDEPLWGQDVEVKGSSVGLSGGGRTDEGSNSKYYIARVPPVNDLHPPIVSGPKSRAETRWMLQPPPSARVMAGKERIGDSTSQNTKLSDVKTEQKQPEAPVQAQPSIQTNSIERSAARVRTSVMAPDGWYDPRADGLEEDGDDESPRYGRDQSHLVITPSLHSRFESCSSLSSDADSEAESPRVSLQSPQTPTSRPGSKGTQDSGKHFPTISKTIATFHQQHQEPNNKVQMLHLEINDSPDDIALGQLERLRPWRWSMDI
ncbi:uncharacterized protein BP01DRAFT_81065 [Aspergillus saccharolyticus JOP 1030-1]|uniref:Uncharacterized protein n=1 Tax=Aspergillus saccharolyticus JOP 1030-1 TaxID=1450539 RepID=A0A318ZA95_9EURO|nr:hypothetical protein BP01DRAFT_81065 [Aspergillus saccharolyticus JOP 1030-1]PYH44365.1 hypothetical protein BP01DRAFT_81065 [Aspergillus saccharolyticus JOP 1030-1]